MAIKKIHVVLVCCIAGVALDVCSARASALASPEGLALRTFATYAAQEPRQDVLSTTPLDDLLVRDDAAALEELSKRFAETREKIQKQRIASVLVRRLDDDGQYWEFLARYAKAAVESDLPFPYAFDANGAALPEQYTPAFLRWANRAKVFPDQAAATAVNFAPLDVFIMALTDDPRGRDLLRTGVRSPNFMVVYRAAWGLARLRDLSAVPSIIETAEALPAQGGEMVARALVLFVDSPEAQAAVDRLIPDAPTRDALRARARQELQMNIGDSAIRNP
jgi:hypothetical protein